MEVIKGGEDEDADEIAKDFKMTLGCCATKLQKWQMKFSADKCDVHRKIIQTFHLNSVACWHLSMRSGGHVFVWQSQLYTR